MDLNTEITGHLTRMRRAAGARGVELAAPLLVLGTSERVGSNRLSDTLRAGAPQHNEPLRQQIGAAHPLSALNPDPVDSDTLTADRLGVYGRHWLAYFVASKYGPVRHVVKETNLYFTVAALLRLLPDAPIAVASRSPLGVANSFTRSGLFHRWGYPPVYRHLLATTRTGERRRYAPLVGDDEPDPLIALVRTIVFNTLLLAEASAGRPAVHVPYESAVADQAAALAGLSNLIGVDVDPPAPPWLSQVGRVMTHSATTNAKSGLVAQLDAGAARQVAEHTARPLDLARTIAPASVADTVAGWLAGAHHLPAHRRHHNHTCPCAPTGGHGAGWGGSRDGLGATRAAGVAQPAGQQRRVRSSTPWPRSSWPTPPPARTCWPSGRASPVTSSKRNTTGSPKIVEDEGNVCPLWKSFRASYWMRRCTTWLPWGSRPTRPTSPR